MATMSAEDFLAAAVPTPAPVGAGGGSTSADDFLRQFAPAAEPSPAPAPAGTPQNLSWYRPFVLGGEAVGRGAAGALRPFEGSSGAQYDQQLTGFNELLGLKTPPPAGGSELASGALRSAMDIPGFTPGLGTYPTLERLGSAGIEGAIGALPFAMGGVVPALAAGASGGMAGEATHELFPDNQWAPAVAGLAFGGLGGGLATGAESMIRGALLPRLATATGGSAKTLQEAGGAIQAGAQNWLDNVLPGLEAEAAAPLDAAIKGKTPIGTAAGPPAPGFDIPNAPGLERGPATPLPNLESTLKRITRESAPDSREASVAKVTQPSTASRLLAALRGGDQAEATAFLRPPAIRGEATPAEAPIPRAPGVKAPGQAPAPAIPGGGRVINSAGEAEGLAVGATSLRPINSPGEKPSAGVGGATLRPIATATTPESIPPVSWDFARDLRSQIGAAMRGSNDRLFKDLGQQNLNDIYAALTRDLESTAKANGAGSQFADFNSRVSHLRTLAEDYVKPIVDAKNPEDAARAALQQSRSGGSRLGALRQVAPSAVDELASAHLLQTPAGWARLAPEAREALVPNPVLRERINTAVGNAPPKLPLGSLGQEAAGAFLGDQLGIVANHLWPHFGLDPYTAGAVGATVGLATPPLLHGVRSVMRSPAALRLPLAGAIGAENALMGQ